MNCHNSHHMFHMGEFQHGSPVGCLNVQFPFLQEVFSPSKSHQCRLLKVLYTNKKTSGISELKCILMADAGALSVSFWLQPCNLCRLLQLISANQWKLGLSNGLVTPVFKKNPSLISFAIWGGSTISIVMFMCLKVNCKTLLSHFFINNQI